MKSDYYEDKIKQARKDLDDLNGNLWDNVIEMWHMGHSLRVISEVSGVSRSKLQRYISEHKEDRFDDPRSQLRNKKAMQAGNLHKMGFNLDEIAAEMGLNRRTIESYFRQLGIKEETKFGD